MHVRVRIYLFLENTGEIAGVGSCWHNQYSKGNMIIRYFCTLQLTVDLEERSGTETCMKGYKCNVKFHMQLLAFSFCCCFIHSTNLSY